MIFINFIFFSLETEPIPINVQQSQEEINTEPTIEETIHIVIEEHTSTPIESPKCSDDSPYQEEQSTLNQEIENPDSPGISIEIIEDYIANDKSEIETMQSDEDKVIVEADEPLALEQEEEVSIANGNFRF